ncbi:hypothetical protein [Thioflexithrix psekupsensis]|uniref:Uncharacterized protein n=1 Tax=Thioflexithrix psekupsensis TaxID=1570016 RepID=A0A251X9D7_9GAMM|nr:hypothetical protein [Thioflexithrix psekupsensis]OUD14581.1 hypothetical protein TPSD3_09855 [Thioflexithrix psekupsensis]
MNNSVPHITLWALESDYDAKTIKVFAEKILAIENKLAEIQPLGKPQRAVIKQGAEGLKKAVKNYLMQSQCVIFIIDRDGPMSQAERRKQDNSLINQVKEVLQVEDFANRVYLYQKDRVRRILILSESKFADTRIFKIYSYKSFILNRFFIL